MTLSSQGDAGSANPRLGSPHRGGRNSPGCHRFRSWFVGVADIWKDILLFFVVRSEWECYIVTVRPYSTSGTTALTPARPVTVVVVVAVHSGNATLLLSI